MSAPPRLPLAARWLLRLSRVPREMRGEVEADLQELFEGRQRDRGGLYARWRLCRDLASLWMQPSTVRTDRSSSPPSTSLDVAVALVRDAGADLKYAARLFARQSGILLLTILGLSLGLGVATAAFSIMNAAVLRGEGLVDPDRVPGVLRTNEQSVSTSWSYDEFRHLRDGATKMQLEASVRDAAAVGTTVTEGDGPSAGVAFVSGGFFAATGGRTVLGRPLERADEDHAGPPPVVVSFLFWTSRLDRDASVVGRSIRVGRTAATIIGVAERGFSLPGNRLLWMPLTAYGDVYGGASSDARTRVAAPRARVANISVEVFGRLSPGVSLPQAEAQLGAVAAALPGDAGVAASHPGVRLDPHAALGRASAADALAIALFVFAVIGLVLLLACANAATVLISTAIAREREIGVRGALGASRARIVRQLVTESLALGTAAAALGLLLARWAIPAIATMIEAPAGADLTPDVTVYMFLGIVTIITGIGAGLAPAWHGRGADLLTPLKGDGARQNRVAPRRLRSALVMTQAAVSVLLIVLAGFFVRATFRAASIDVGFDAAHLYAVSNGFGGPYDDRSADLRSFWARAVPELQMVPGIAAVTLVELTPFSGITRSSAPGDAPDRVVHFNRTRADYFAVLGVRVLAGRTYTADEVASAAPVAVVSQSLARAYWHGESPLGQPLPPQIPVESTRPVIIGVVADTITARLHEGSTFAVYETLGPESERYARLLMRVTPGAAGALQQASQRLRAIDPQADIRVASVGAQVQEEAARPRMLATLTGSIGVTAIVLCVIGLYGLTASVVGQRTREMGVRVALGADRRDLLRLLLWDSLKPVIIGLAAGFAAALLATRVAAAVVFFGVSTKDPVAFAAAVALLLVAALLAVLVPTRRAASVDPAFVLRQS